MRSSTLGARANSILARRVRDHRGNLDPSKGCVAAHALVMLSGRQIANAPKVIHRHRMGERTFCCVSELTYLGTAPFAVLYWINSAGVRTPITVALDAGKLHKAAGRKPLYFYSGVTLDPRYLDTAPLRAP